MIGTSGPQWDNERHRVLKQKRKRKELVKWKQSYWTIMISTRYLPFLFAFSLVLALSHIRQLGVRTSSSPLRRCKWSMMNVRFIVFSSPFFISRQMFKYEQFKWTHGCFTLPGQGRFYYTLSSLSFFLFLVLKWQYNHAQSLNTHDWKDNSTRHFKHFRNGESFMHFINFLSNKCK